MINHARTLLMNRSGGSQALTDLGEEYIPVVFVAQKLPNWLKLYWQVLFGYSPDNLYRNYQVSRLLRIIHSTEYEPYLYEQDDRITYDPTAPEDFAEAEYVLTLHDTELFTTYRVNRVDRVGDLTANEVFGNMFNRWLLELHVPSRSVVATNERTGSEVLTSDAWAAGTGDILSELITLPDTDMRVRLLISVAGAAPAGDFFYAKIDALARPVEDLTVKFNTVDSLGGYAHTLFDSFTSEPYKTFYELWQQNTSFPDRVAGFVLAMLRQLNTLYYSTGTNR